MIDPAASPLPIHAITFLTKARQPLTAADLDWFLDEGNRFADRLGLTGVSLCCGDQFFHHLEGTSENIAAIYAHVNDNISTLQVDAQLLHESTGDQRHFDRWYTGFPGFDQTPHQQASTRVWQSMLPTTRDTPDMVIATQLIMLYWSKWVAGMR